MKLQVFRAPTLKEALEQVKAVMGHDALIWHTRTIAQRYCLGLRRKVIVEITAGHGHAARQVRAEAAARVNVHTHGHAGARAAAHGPPGQSLLATPAAGSAMYLDFTRQVDALKAMMCELSKDVRRQSAPQVPEELLEYYVQLVAAQVDPEIACEALRSLHDAARPESLKLPEFVREKLIEQLERMLPVAGTISRTKGQGPHVVALIGPTGVGKTTTIAKLAANLMLREKHRVGLITIDTYRIAAIEQLKKYADIIGAPLRVVGSTEELAGAIESMNDCEHVLIDTAGRGPNDTLKIGELRNFISTARADEVHLVLSATSSQECAELAFERFGAVRIDRVIFTKLDEARHVGIVLNVARRMRKPLSYVTTGQDVPDDIEVARGRRIAQLILGSEL